MSVANQSAWVHSVPGRSTCICTCNEWRILPRPFPCCFATPNPDSPCPSVTLLAFQLNAAPLPLWPQMSVCVCAAFAASLTASTRFVPCSPALLLVLLLLLHGIAVAPCSCPGCCLCWLCGCESVELQVQKDDKPFALLLWAWYGLIIDMRYACYTLRMRNVEYQLWNEPSVHASGIVGDCVWVCVWTLVVISHVWLVDCGKSLYANSIQWP